MAKLLPDVSHTFNEYLLIPGHTTKKCIPDNVSLCTPLVKYKKGETPSLTMNIPMVSAIMPLYSAVLKSFHIILSSFFVFILSSRRSKTRRLDHEDLSAPGVSSSYMRDIIALSENLNYASK